MTFVRFLAFLAVVLMSAGPLAARAAAAGDEDNTPPVEDFLETRRYTEAATREVLGQFSYVVGEVDGFPGNPSPDKVKKTFLRKRLLDLRLMIDLNAFAYKQGSIDRYRELVDLAYEAVGAYKDLFDVQAIDGLPIDPVEQDRRLNAMNDTIAPFRQADVREKLEKAVDHVTSKPTDLDFDTQPRLWQIAQLQPIDSLDSAGNAA